MLENWATTRREKKGIEYEGQGEQWVGGGWNKGILRKSMAEKEPPPPLVFLLEMAGNWVRRTVQSSMESDPPTALMTTDAKVYDSSAMVTRRSVVAARRSIAAARNPGFEPVNVV